MTLFVIIQTNFSPYKYGETQHVLSREVISGFSDCEWHARGWLDQILDRQGYSVDIFIQVVSLTNVVSCWDLSRESEERENLKEELRREIREEMEQERDFD